MQRPSASDASTTLIARRVILSRIDADDWNRGALAAGGSVRSSYAHLETLRLKILMPAGMETFIVWRSIGGQEERIGHFIVTRRKGTRYFYDGVCLREQHQRHWADVVAMALEAYGPGQFEYGWEWSLERCREEELRRLSGVSITGVRNITVHAIDFAAWGSWEGYKASVSENVRRNARKAPVQYPGIRLAYRRGLLLLLDIPKLTLLRRAMYLRKGLPFRPIRIGLGYLAGALLYSGDDLLVSAKVGRKAIAINRFTRFGPLTYFRDGAAIDQPGGAVWYLMLTVLGRFYGQAPQAKILMGYVEVKPNAEPADGLFRARRSLRASDFPTSVLSFVWDGAATAARGA